MGILGLAKLLGDNAPGAMKENDIKNYFGRKIAIDASMSIYQFLIAVRSDGSQLTNEAGETTSHLMGMFYRTIRMVENGIKPCYVFDGKPPQMKSGELTKRKEKRDEAQKELDKATETGDTENMEKFSRRLAPCEAEAQCAELVKSGQVFATATEDMDALTFGTNILLRHMTFSEARKMPIQEYHTSQVLSELELNMDEFIDLCILLGCDYCGSIKGIGPKTAIKLIQEHKSIENILKNIDTTKHPVPENWLYKEARNLFQDPEVTPSNEIKLTWSEPDVEGLVKFMATEKGFAEDRIRNGAKKLTKAKGAATQGRLDSFFKVIPSNKPAVKRKSEDVKPGSAKKKAKGGGKFKGK